MTEQITINHHAGPTAKLREAEAVYRTPTEQRRAETLSWRALEGAGAAGLEVAQVLQQLAGIHEERGEYAHAERFYRRSIKALEQAPGAAARDRLRFQAWCRLGALHRQQERYESAESLLHRAHALAEKACGLAGPEVVEALVQLALLDQEQGRFAAAELLYQRALFLIETTAVPDRFEPFALATVLQQRAGLELARGCYAVGAAFARRALEIKTQGLGAQHLEVARAATTLAALLAGQGECDEAATLYRQAIAIYETAWGADHNERADCLGSLAALLQQQGCAAEAEDCCRRALAKEAF